MSGVKPLPTPQELRDLLRYDPKEGRLYWKKSRYRVKEGDRAGNDTSSGYRAIKIMQRQIMEHRVCWAIHYGKWPASEIDHINRKKDDNRIENLREATRSQNMLNGTAKGYRRNRGKWEAYVQTNGVHNYLGRFDTEEEARQARIEAMKDHTP